jgi:hypothetical protein
LLAPVNRTGASVAAATREAAVGLRSLRRWPGAVGGLAEVDGAGAVVGTRSWAVQCDPPVTVWTPASREAVAAGAKDGVRFLGRRGRGRRPWRRRRAAPHEGGGEQGAQVHSGCPSGRRSPQVQRRRRRTVTGRPSARPPGPPAPRAAGTPRRPAAATPPAGTAPPGGGGLDHPLPRDLVPVVAHDGPDGPRRTPAMSSATSPYVRTWPGGIRSTTSSTCRAYGVGGAPARARTARPAEAVAAGRFTVQSVTQACHCRPRHEQTGPHDVHAGAPEALPAGDVVLESFTCTWRCPPAGQRRPVVRAGARSAAARHRPTCCCCSTSELVTNACCTPARRSSSASRRAQVRARDGPDEDLTRPEQRPYDGREGGWVPRPGVRPRRARDDPPPGEGKTAWFVLARAAVADRRTGQPPADQDELGTGPS